ncbi:MAG TPA: glutamate--tRNA ligase [Alphaproteobacteria bacterium]|nr:glutamate--tRNA ligase [Alphaproteobacteria bacterium]
MSDTEIITRFAPSPTGYLHIGGARTALFNYLFARRHGGKFLLRIEDTDRERSTPEAVDAILDGMKWLGLNHDGEPIFQFARAARHAEVAHQLLASGKAYKCFATPEELEAMREEQKAKGLPQRYDGRWRDRPESDVPPNTPYAIRIKVNPENRQDKDIMVVEDKVQGIVNVPLSQLDDFVILRSDGTPTYMLAVVVDDYDMKVTHVIRGDDHLTNTFRQNTIYYNMDWTPPIYAHLPMIHGPDGGKLSKRHGAVDVNQYRHEGYLPIAMRNYLLRLGFGHGDQEFFSDAEAIALFDLAHVGKSPSRFDYDKLGSINNHYMREADVNDLKPLLQKPDAWSDASFEKAIILFRERAKTLIEVQSEIDKLAAAPSAAVPDDAKLHLLAIADRLKPEQSPEAIEQLLKNYVAEAGVPFKIIGQGMRIALVGQPQAPAIGQLVSILGVEESVKRIKAAA